MRTSESISNIAAALAKFQGEVKQPKKDTNNPFFNKKYVPLEGVVSVITEPLSKNGLSYFQSTATVDENVIVKTMVMHESGEFIESDELKLPGYQIQKGGGKDFNPQGIGAAITYGRRYSLTAALGIASEDDDDGNTGSQGQSDKKQSGRESKTEAGAITPSIKAKYQLIHGDLKGIEAFVAQHPKDADSVLTKIIQDKNKGGN
ncbi:ERF family protein [Paenibacillus sp. T2-29]